MKIKVNGEEKKIELDQENALLSNALNSMVKSILPETF